MNRRTGLGNWAFTLDRLIDERRAESTEAVAPKTLRWLALLPEWTESLAVDCGFPTGQKGIEAMIEEAHDAMLCDVVKRTDLISGETVRFWMPSTMRSWLFRHWEGGAGMRLDAEVSEIASRILAAHSRRQPVSRGILRWAQLAEAELSHQVVTGEPLSERMQESLGAGNLAEAGEWLFAAEWLAKPLGAVMEMAASRARRQISLFHLRARDAEYLARFLRRDGEIEELKRLAASDGEWGVHFIGPSGVGKTMLMRFITSPHEANPIRRSSRIDFDYIDPRIPLERPARLLQEFGEGFATKLETAAQETLFKSFLEALRTAESAREAAGPHGYDLPTAAREFHQAVEAFALFLKSLPQPVALVIDTCEELAKLHPPGGQMWSVNATFEIVEQIHEAMPELKLVVAGRRWLTEHYANETRRPPTPVEVSKAPPRRYLRFYETRSFTEQEARRYLSEVRRLEIDDNVIKTVLDSTSDDPRVPGTIVLEDEENRYSPNDIAFCATLLEEAPELGPKAVADGNFDRYVEERIFKRLENSPELVRLFPAASILGHFDAAAIEPFLGNTAPARRALLASLIAEDWTHLEGGPEPEEIVLKVDPGLLPRLRSYYDGTYGRQRIREETKRTLRKHLAAKLEMGPPEATVEVVDAAVCLLPSAEAVEKLERAAERVVETGAWSWAEAVCQRLLDAEREPALDESLSAIVWALYLTAMKHSQVRMSLTELWEGVGQMAAAHPDQACGKLLATRSRLNALAAAAVGEFDLKDAAVRIANGRRCLGRPGGREVASALLAASEALIDVREDRGKTVPVAEVNHALLALSRHYRDRPALVLHLATLRGRLHAFEDRARAGSAFTQVALLVRGVDEELGQFADWDGSFSPTVRSMLELLRFRLAGGDTGEGLLGRSEEIAFASEPGADSAQLLSLVLQVRMAKGTLTAVKLMRAGAYESRLASYRLTASAHRTAPPLFVSVARGWMVLGDFRRGLALLRERERLATSRRTEESSTSAAALALLGALRRMRLREGLALASHLIAGDEERRAEALAAGALIAGLQPTLPPESEDDHASWRVRNLLEPGTAKALLSPERIEGGVVADSQSTVHCWLDLLESELVRQRREGRRLPTQTATWLRGRLMEVAPVGEVPISDPLGREQMRLQLRYAALIDEFELPRSPLKGQLGRIAQEEGELLALRLPDRAESLLALAADSLAEVGAVYGAFIAELCLAITEIHAGKEQNALRRRERILGHYETMREDREELPALGALSLRNTEELLQPDEPLRGWIWRLGFYLQWSEGKSGGPRAAAAALEFGPEFSLRTASGFKRQGRRVVRRRARRPRLAPRLPAPPRWLPALAVLVTLAVIGLSTTLLITVVTIVILLVTPVVIELVGPHLPRRLLPLSGFELSLVSLRRLEQGPALQAFGYATAQPRAKRLPLRLYLYGLRRWRPPEYAVVPTGAEIAAEVGLPENVRQALRRPLFGHPIPLRLEVGSDLAWAAWERILLSEQILDPRWSPGRSPQILRVRPRGFPSPKPKWHGDVVAVCTPRWRQFLETSSRERVRWLPGAAAAPVGPGRSQTPDGEAAEEPRSLKAAIALGAAVETKAGWRLRLDQDQLDESLADPEEPQLQQLVGPETLARKFSMVVLVCPPGGEPGAADRQSSEGLRSLANEIFLAGSHSVVTLPALPPAVAAEAIEILTHWLTTWEAPPNEEELRTCVEQVRFSIFERTRQREHEDEAERLRRAELALDVCLYGPRPKRGNDVSLG